MHKPQDFNAFGAPYLPGQLGIVIDTVSATEVRAHLPVRKELLAPNGFLHAATVIALADTAAGYGCVAALPDGASGFTTIELKSNHLGTARDGTIACVATAVHAGRTTQVWDATVVHADTGKTIALFRCTQMVLYPSQPPSTPKI
jgi:1,4-dihydroxy-2-naphthoyl-CoA hydrolase